MCPNSEKQHIKNKHPKTIIRNRINLFCFFHPCTFMPFWLFFVFHHCTFMPFWFVLVCFSLLCLHAILICFGVFFIIVPLYHFDYFLFFIIVPSCLFVHIWDRGLFAENLPVILCYSNNDNNVPLWWAQWYPSLLSFVKNVFKVFLITSCVFW